MTTNLAGENLFIRTSCAHIHNQQSDVKLLPDGHEAGQREIIHALTELPPRHATVDRPLGYYEF